MPEKELHESSDIRSFERAPLVSIVIPCYNHAHYLGQAIESVQRQTWPTVEIIVVDDGSTDDTAAVVARYPSVTGLSQPNQGLSAARNAGLKASHGRYILFLDADDLLVPNALEKAVGEMTAHPECAFVSGAFYYADEQGTPGRKLVFEDVVGDHYLTLLTRNYIAMHATVLYRRDSLEEVGGFDASLRACEDYDVYLKIARQHPVRQFREGVALYRRHGENMSGDPKRMMVAALEVLSRQQPYVGEDPRRRDALRAGLRRHGDLYGRQLLIRSLRGLFQRGHVLESAGDIVFVWRRSRATFLKSPIRGALQMMPPSLRDWLRAHRPARLRRKLNPVRFGSFRRVTPISASFGYDRGLPIDRRYIETFLEQHTADVRGRVLEIGDNTYTKRFGGTRVTQSDVLNVSEGNPSTTLVGDLATADHVPSTAFDCIIFTQTLQWVYDFRGALSTLQRILKPGGVILATVPGISKVDRYDGTLEWYWSFTPASARRLFEEYFPSATVTVESHGNVLSAMSFLYGLAFDELERRELDHSDPSFPVIISIRAVKG